MPNGLSLNTAVGSDRIEVGDAAKLEKAEIINLQFSGGFVLRSRLEDQISTHWLTQYF